MVGDLAATAAAYSTDGGVVAVDTALTRLSDAVWLGQSRGLWIWGVPGGERPIIDGGSIGFGCMVIARRIQGGAPAVTVVSNLVFQHCGNGGHRTTPADTLSINSGDVTANGGAILANGTGITVTDVVIRWCGCQLNGGGIALTNSDYNLVMRTSVYHTRAGVFGGGIAVDAAHVTIQDVNVTSCVGYQGGGGLFVGMATLDLQCGTPLVDTLVSKAIVAASGMRVTNNTAVVGHGGGWLVSGHPTQTGARSGGRIAVSYPPFVQVGRGVVFTNNSALRANGGGIAATDRAVVAGVGLPIQHIVGAVFDSNAAVSGGAVYGTSGATIVCQGCNFTRNMAVASWFAQAPDKPAVGVTASTAGWGGHALVDSKCSWTCNGCIFAEGVATGGSGGAMAMLNKAFVVLSHCSLLRNRADALGGGVVVSQLGSTRFQDSVLVSNRCSKGGGGVAVIPGLAQVNQHDGLSFVRLHRLRFENNTATSGGGAGLFTVAPVATTCDNCSFHGGTSLFGSSQATGATALSIANKASIEAQRQFPGIELRPQVPVLLVLDSFGQVVAQPSALNIRVRLSDTSTTTRAVFNGTAVFEGLAVQGAEGSNTTLQFFIADSHVLSTELSVQLGRCPPGYRFSDADSTCVACIAGTYTVAPGSRVCLPCPYGATCAGPGDVTNRVGFFGVTSTSTSPAGEATATTTTLSMQACPSNYCGWLSAKGAAPSFQACLANRTGVLCGACPAGWSVTVDSSACVHNSQCTDAWWVIPVWLLYAVGFTVYLVMWQSQSSTGLFSVVAYWYQMAALVSLTDNKDRVEATIEQVASSVFSLRVTSGGSSATTAICPFPMNPVQAMAIDYALPLVVGTLLALLALVAAAVRCCALHCVPTAPPGKALRRGLLGGARKARNKARCQPGGRCACGSWLAHKCSKLPPCKRKPFAARLSSAVVRFILFAYAHVAFTSFTLVQCVSVGGVQRLFKAASVECFQPWQWVIIPCLAALCVVPVLLPVALTRCHRRGVGKDVENGFVSGVISNPTTSMYAALTRQFRPGLSQRVWASWMLLQRLALVMVAVGVGSFPLTRQLVMAMMCLVFLCTQLLVAPFAVGYMNAFQGALQALLLAVAVLNVVTATVETVTAPPSAPVDAALDTTSGIVLALYCLPALGGVALQCAKYRAKWARKRRDNTRRDLAPTRILSHQQLTTVTSPPRHANAYAELNEGNVAT